MTKNGFGFVFSRVVCLLVLVSMAFSAPGCQSNLAMKRIAAKNPLSKNAAKTPTKMVDVWKTYAQTTPDGTTMRGVAGRIHFYSESKQKNAVKVDGDVTVFLFDGDEKDPAHAKPIRVFQFKSNTLQKHYAFKKPLGHGYDFFLPIDEIDGEEKNLCVMTRFDDRLEGTLVLAPPVNTILKGTKREPPRETPFQEFLAHHSILGKIDSEKQSNHDAGDSSGEIEQASYRSSASEGRDRAVTTISLTDQMTRRLAQAHDSGPSAREGADDAKTMPLVSAREIPEQPKTVEPASWNQPVKQSPAYSKKIDYPKTPYPK